MVGSSMPLMLPYAVASSNLHAAALKLKTSACLCDLAKQQNQKQPKVMMHAFCSSPSSDSCLAKKDGTGDYSFLMLTRLTSPPHHDPCTSA